MSKFYIVSSEILPEVLSKVLQAQMLLHTGQARKISEAVKAVGISRGTYYKYKDMVFFFNEGSSRRKAIITMVIEDHKGVLSVILSLIANLNINVLAINQTVPVNDVSNVVLTVDISDLDIGIHSLVAQLEKLERVHKAELVAVE